MKEQDVTKGYYRSAAPGKGVITYDAGYRVGSHRDEIAMAQWLHRTFGGDIHLFNERGYTSVSPDYRWNGKLWELKGPSTVTATDNAVKKALVQIISNPGGIILDYCENEITDEILTAVKQRIDRSSLQYTAQKRVDIMLIHKGGLVKILRYEK